MVLYCISSVILLMFFTLTQIVIKVGSRHTLIGRNFFSLLLLVGAILVRSHFRGRIHGAIVAATVGAIVVATIATCIRSIRDPPPLEE